MCTTKVGQGAPGAPLLCVLLEPGGEALSDPSPTFPAPKGAPAFSRPKLGSSVWGPLPHRRGPHSSLLPPCCPPFPAGWAQHCAQTSVSQKASSPRQGHPRRWWQVASEPSTVSSAAVPPRVGLRCGPGVGFLVPGFRDAPATEL